MPLTSIFAERWMGYTVPAQFSGLIENAYMETGYVNMTNVFKMMRVTPAGGRPPYTALISIDARALGVKSLENTSLEEVPMYSIAFANEDIPHFLP